MEALMRGEGLRGLLYTVTAGANRALRFRDAVAICLTAVCDFTGWEGGCAWTRAELDPDAKPQWRRLLSHGEAARTGPGPLIERAATSGRPAWHDQEDAGAVFALPVTDRGTVAAVLEFRGEVARPDPDFDEAAVRLGTELGHALRRERDETRIRFQARILDAVGQAVIASDANHRVVYWNRAAEDLYGWSGAEALGRIDSEVLQARVSADQTAEITARLAAGQTWEGEFEVRHKSGEIIPVHITGAAVVDADGSTVGYVGVGTDLRRSRELEQRLRGSQRMEAVGRLAGGVAHDFNNLLTSIKGITHLMLEDLPTDHPMRGDVDEIRSATDRAAALTSQLLAFSRRQVLRPRVLDLNAAIEGRVESLRTFVGNAIHLISDLERDIPCVEVDASQLGQVVHNLIANARDALPDGGTITIRTRRVILDRAAAHRIATGMGPGEWVLLEIEDTGPGIPAHELERIFDPFFSNKPITAAAGLGLSTVYGIVQQSEGHIAVDSVVGAGTAVRIFLPPVEGRPDAEPATHLPERGAGSETLLLVEDEDSVRRLGHKILSRHGYRVIEARDGVDALERLDEHEGPIDLVVTDVVMPRMGGAELARRLRQRLPDTPVLFVSGYADDDRIRDSIAASGDSFLEKPFTPDAFAKEVRAALDARARPDVR